MFIIESVAKRHDGEERVVRDRAREEKALVLAEILDDPPGEVEDGRRRKPEPRGDLHRPYRARSSSFAFMSVRLREAGSVRPARLT
jgi:hypothetical protein